MAVLSDALRFPGAQEVPEWIETARRQCRSEIQVWQIPATDTVVAHVTWDVSRMENSWRNEGRVYYAASQRAQARGVAAPVVPKDVEELLAPLRQHLRRDSHPERLALLELMASLQENTEAQEENSERIPVQLQSYQEKMSFMSTFLSIPVCRAWRFSVNSVAGVQILSWKLPLTTPGPASAVVHEMAEGCGKEFGEPTTHQRLAVRRVGGHRPVGGLEMRAPRRSAGDHELI
eukprot:s1249_g11.t1